MRRRSAFALLAALAGASALAANLRSLVQREGRWRSSMAWAFTSVVPIPEISQLPRATGSCAADRFSTGDPCA